MSVALNYFLNASLDTTQTGFALAAMKNIDSALAKEKEKAKLPPTPKGLSTNKKEEVIDLLEVYYYNEVAHGIEFTDDEINLYSLSPSSSEEGDLSKTVSYQNNRKSWKKFCLEILKQTNDHVIPLRKPRNSEPMSQKEWFILAADLSTFLRSKKGYKISRDLSDRWFLQAIPPQRT